MIYQYPEGIPEQYAGIVEEVRTKAQEVRSTHIQRLRSGNAAVAKLPLDTGAVYNKEATSKQHPLNIPGEDDGPKCFFEPRIDRAIDRAGENYNEKHAEHKLFNAIAEDLETNNVSLEVEGTLYLYTERNMCSGCYMNLQDFKERFPNIKVIIFYEHPYP